MKNPMEVLKMKEQELLRIKREIEALKVAIRILNNADEAAMLDRKPELRQVIEMP